MQRSNAHYPALRKLASLSWADRWLLVQLFVLLGVTRLALRSVPQALSYFGPLVVLTTGSTIICPDPSPVLNCIYNLSSRPQTPHPSNTPPGLTASCVTSPGTIFVFGSTAIV